MLELTELLPLLAVRVLLAANDDCVDCDQNSQNTGQDCLHYNKDEASNSLCGLRHAKLLNENQDACDRKHAHDLDGAVDPVTRLERVWSRPQKDTEQECLNNELTGSLGKTMTVGTSNNTSTGESVNNGGHEDPPVAPLVVLVEDGVLAPGVLVVIKSRVVTLELLVLVSNAPDPPGEKGQDSCESSQRDSSKYFGAPRVSILELVNTIQDPDTIKEHDQVGDCLCQSPPVTLAEAGQALGEGSEQSPGLENNLQEENSDSDGGDNDRKPEKNSHEGVTIGDLVLLDVALDTLDCVDNFVVLAATVGGAIDIRLELVTSPQKNVANTIEAALGQGHVLVDMHKCRVCKKLDTVSCEIATRLFAKVVDGCLHALPVNQTRAESEVLRPTSVDTRNIGAHHAVHSHSLEPENNIPERGARVGGTSVTSTG